MQKPVSIQGKLYDEMKSMKNDSNLRSFSDIIKHFMKENKRLTEEIQRLTEENCKLTKDLNNISSYEI